MLWLRDGAGQQRAHPVDRGGMQVVVRHLHLQAAGAQPVGAQPAGVHQVAGGIQGMTAAGLLQVVVRPEIAGSASSWIARMSWPIVPLNAWGNH